jgi:hypothetical protein
LPPGERVDELGDFVEWLANAKPEDEKAIRAEIKRYYYDVGDTVGGNALNAALSDVLEPGVTPKIRQEILDGIAHYAVSDPAEVAQARNLIVRGILLFSGGGRHLPSSKRRRKRGNSAGPHAETISTKDSAVICLTRSG